MKGLSNILIIILATLCFASCTVQARQKAQHYVIAVVLDRSPIKPKPWAELKAEAKRAYRLCSSGDFFQLYTVTARGARLEFYSREPSYKPELRRFGHTLGNIHPSSTDAQIAASLQGPIYNRLRKDSSPHRPAIIVLLTGGTTTEQLMVILNFAQQVKSKCSWGFLPEDFPRTRRAFVNAAFHGLLYIDTDRPSEATLKPYQRFGSYLWALFKKTCFILCVGVCITLLLRYVLRKATEAVRSAFAPLPKVSPRRQTTSNSKPARATAAQRKTAQRSSPSYRGDTGVFDPEPIKGSKILAMGCGSVGSPLLRNLAGTVPLEIYVVDPASVRPKHTRGLRTIFPPGRVGEQKVFALKETLEHECPGTVVYADPSDVMDIPDDDLCGLARGSDVVLASFDFPPGLIRVNDRLYWLNDIVYVAGHRLGRSGHIIHTAPGISACLRCVTDITSASQLRQLNAEPALSLDLRNLANHAAIFVLELLYSKKTGKPITRWDITKTVWYFANTLDRNLSPDGPGIILQRPEKHSGCPVCNSTNR